MATQLQLRRGTTSENASFTGAVGEVTVDTTKDTLIVQDGSTAGGFELARADGSNFVATSVDINGGTIDGTTIGASSASTGAFTTLTASGEITANGGIALGDGDKATFGAGDDLQIYHDGAHSYIDDTGTGSLYIRASNLAFGKPDGTEFFGSLTSDGGCFFKFDNATKLLTTNTGIDVTGTATMDGLTVSASQAGGVTAQIQNSNPTQTGGSRLDFLYSGSTVTGRIQNRFNGSDFQTDWYTGNHGLKIFTDSAKTEKRLDIAHNGDISFYEDTGTTPKLFWDASAESLGIGTSSPACHLDVKGSGNGSVSDHLRITSTDTDSKLAFVTTTGNGAIVQSGYAMLFMANTANTERMRIDPSGNLLVGKTSADNTTAGCRVRGDGFASFVRSGAEPVLINRLTNDGSLLTLQKGGTTVGSIGVSSSNNLTVGSSASGHVGFELGNQYLPLNGGSASNGELDLGSSTRRFKDLYLSGAVYLGGTGAANKLDDYEEGTWTPTAQLYSGTMTVNSATYTKIGNLVTLKASVTFDATTDNSAVSIQNVPFAHTGANKANGGYVTASTVATASKISGVGSGTFNLKDASGSAVTYTAIAGSTLDFVLIYETA